MYLCTVITMDRATFDSQKTFAGEKKHLMQRHCIDNDYTAHRMYMVTNDARLFTYHPLRNEKMEKQLGKVLLGVKQACNHAFREVLPVEIVAVTQQHAETMDRETIVTKTKEYGYKTDFGISERHCGQ